MSTSAPTIESHICFAIYSAAHALNAAYRPLLEPLGLTYPQYMVLLQLWERDGQTVKEIGRRMRLDSGTLTPLLKRMESAGLVSRMRDRDDERRVVIQLARKGRDLEQESATIRARIGCALGQSEAEIIALRDQITAMVERLRQADATR